MSSLLVLIDDDVVAELTRARNGRLELTYTEPHASGRSPTPLSVSLPVQRRRHAGPRLTSWLWGLLPDNDAVLARWARQFQVSASSPYSLLSTPVGLDCAGAVRFVAPDRLAEVTGNPGRVDWLTTSAVGGRLAELRTDNLAWLGQDFAGRFSLPGAQAKTALTRDGDRWGLPHGAAATTHILKPAIAGFDDHDLNEHLCLRAAAHAGLLVARSEVVTFGEEQAVAVERFDRIRRGDRVVRVHQEDLCQALGRHPAEKYQNDGGPGPDEIAALFRQTMPAPIAQDAVWRFADALVWNWVIAGTDAHAKNYGLLLAGSEVRLAPLYDIASALPYDVHLRRLRLAMRFGNEYRVHTVRRSSFDSLASQLKVGVDDLIERSRALVDGVVDAFAEAARETASDSDLPERMIALVAERADTCALVLARSE